MRTSPIFTRRYYHEYFCTIEKNFRYRRKNRASIGIIKEAGKLLSGELNDQVSDLVQLLRYEAKVVN